MRRTCLAGRSRSNRTIGFLYITSYSLCCVSDLFAIPGLFPTTGFQIVIERGSSEDPPCLGNLAIKSECAANMHPNEPEGKHYLCNARNPVFKQSLIR